jgi:hypothetical protein
MSAHCVEEEDPMSRHAGSFTAGIFAGALCLAANLSLSALAASASPPDFASNPSVGWFAFSRQFIPPTSGPGPVRPDPAHPLVSNDEFRVSGRQATFPMGDPNSEILQPWAKEVIRKRNERVLSGKPAYSMHASCYPVGVTQFLLLPMTIPMYIVQGPKEVVMILEDFADVRRIYLTDKHPANVKPSWYGDSIGHYEGDTLVVDTIGFNGKTFVDQFDTPHTTQLHIVERFHLIDGGRTLEVNVHVEDPGAFTTPWNAIQRYRRFEQTVAGSSIAKLPMLATPEDGPLIEAICAENPNSLMGLDALPVPQTAKPDF